MPLEDDNGIESAGGTQNTGNTQRPHPTIRKAFRWVVTWWIDHTFFFTFSLTVVYAFLLILQPRFLPEPMWFGDSKWRFTPPVEHPITTLVKKANSDWDEVISKGAAITSEMAISNYRAVRGRNPPPGFRIWADEAIRQNGRVIEKFFDRIYHDLEPFWSEEPEKLRFKAYTQENVIRIRNGKVSYYSNAEDKHHWVETWAKFLTRISAMIPDVDIPVNVMTTPRIAVTHEDMKGIMEKSLATRKLAKENLVREYTGQRDKPDVHPDTITLKHIHNWMTDVLSSDPALYWFKYKATCPSPTADPDSDLGEHIGHIFPKRVEPRFTTAGFISNVTEARDPCYQPHLRGMYGQFVEAESVLSSGSLMPIFSGSKFPGNNDILLPSPIYLKQFQLGHRYPNPLSDKKQEDESWKKKKGMLFWRGVASGGVTRATNWWRFQRHRFVQMASGLRAREVYNDGTINTPTFRLPYWINYTKDYPVAFKHHPVTDMEVWLNETADVAFTDMLCTDPPLTGSKGCWYTDNMIEVDTAPDRLERFNDYQITADLDGTTHSAGWLDVLRSNTLPLKATLLSEWHDDRLQPWVHYVPMDQTYLDLYALLDYFLKPKPGTHFDYGYNNAAKKIAGVGSYQARKWLTQKDMELYTWRLLLEYARIMDDNRDRMDY